MNTKVLQTVMAVGLVMTTAGLAGAGDLKTDWDLTDLYPNLEAWEKAKAEIAQEIEGIATTREIYQLAGRLDIEMPITEPRFRPPDVDTE